jgi:stage V sporulation protein AD
MVFAHAPSVAGTGTVAGKKEGEGPLGGTVDYLNEDTTFGETTWEKSESRMQTEALSRAAVKAGLGVEALELIFAGDLLNQCIGTTFGLRDCERPFFGLYGACSTMAEGLTLCAMAIDGGFAGRAAALVSSHFCSAERQYRMPLEYGGQRTPTAQWTVTGAAAMILSETGPGPYLTHAAVGRIVDAGIKDPANMGAAMAPAAHDTLSGFFADTGMGPADFDLIVTGDLGTLGADLLRDLFARDGVDLGPRYTDCGLLIYDREKQDVHAGGSGCACGALVLCGHILDGLRHGAWNRVLFCGTGALLSPVSSAQGESIPSICHLAAFSR